MANTALIPENLRKKAPPAATALKKQEPPEPIRWYRVLSDRQVPRASGQGGGAFMLRKGKEINSGSYPIRTMLAAGAELEEIPTPAWFLEKQHEARETHQAWADAGLDVGEVPPPYEPPLTKAQHEARKAAKASAAKPEQKPAAQQ